MRRIPRHGLRRPHPSRASYRAQTRYPVLLSHRRGPHPLWRRVRHEGHRQRGRHSHPFIPHRGPEGKGPLLRDKRHPRPLGAFRKGAEQDRRDRPYLCRLERRRFQHRRDHGRSGAHILQTRGGTYRLRIRHALSFLPRQPRPPRHGEQASRKGMDVPSA